jgi:hypothetical protein
VRALYSILIYVTVTLAITTVWALGHQFSVDAQLAREQLVGVPRDFTVAAARTRAAEHADDTPATRPAQDDPTGPHTQHLTPAGPLQRP